MTDFMWGLITGLAIAAISANFTLPSTAISSCSYETAKVAMSAPLARPLPKEEGMKPDMWTDSWTLSARERAVFTDCMRSKHYAFDFDAAMKAPAGYSIEESKYWHLKWP